MAYFSSSCYIIDDKIKNSYIVLKIYSLTWVKYEYPLNTDTKAAHQIKIVETGIERNVRKEVTDVIEGKNSKVTVRRKRFEEDIKRLEKLGPITEATKEAYISRVLNEIYLTPKQSQNLYKRNISARHPNTPSKDLKNYETSETYLRLETYEECMAKFKTSLYIAQSTNDFLLNLLLSEGLLTEGEYKQRYLLGGDPKKASIHNVQQIQKNELLNEQNLSGATQDDYRR